MADHYDGEGKRRLKFSSKIVIASVSAVVAYTIGIFLLEWANLEHLTNIQIPSEVTISWYSFWTVELVSLASIERSKIKNKYEKDEPGEGVL